ncbi:hypothetical protein DQG13_03635 [Paenibacillus sp. YN15]|nr:hypothetical protein DQG13_03635 [Paenibacillus sp. YN15]
MEAYADSRTGASLGQWPWPVKERLQPLSYMYRNFIIGGYVHGEPGARGSHKLSVVDLFGDGFHELVRDIPGEEGEVLDRFGKKIGAISGSVSFVGKLFGLPEELFCQLEHHIPFPMMIDGGIEAVKLMLDIKIAC